MASQAPLKASSSTDGFFTERPIIGNQFVENAALRRVLESYVPVEVQRDITPDLRVFGGKVVSGPILRWTADAERNEPYLRTWDAFGRRKDDLVTSEGWRQLHALGIQEGLITIAYENQFTAFSRVYQFSKALIFTGSSATVTCPYAMTDGAARLVSHHLASPTTAQELQPILQSAYDRLTSRDTTKAWTSGQWMTERQGGSDVSMTETIAVRASEPLESKGVDGVPLGPYSISGFKWFSSATDANMAVLLARTPDYAISTFLAPMRRTVPGTDLTELNGVNIQRLKTKYGTKALPTAELVLNDMRGYLLGKEGQGIREISTILNITRMWTAISTMGYWCRGLAISRAFAKARIIGGKKLMDVPAHVKTMAGNEVEYRGFMHLTFFTTLLLGYSEQDPRSQISIDRIDSLKNLKPSHPEAQLLLRILTPIVKAVTAKAGIAGLSECMESLGGVGYLENDEMEFNVARLLRDAQVMSIWEGTTDVLAADLLKVLKGRQGKAALVVLTKWLGGIGVETAGYGIRWKAWLANVENGGIEALKVQGRDVMIEAGRIIAGCLLKLDADRDGNDVAQEVARRWRDGRKVDLDDVVARNVQMDRRIVFDDSGASMAKL